MSASFAVVNTDPTPRAAELPHPAIRSRIVSCGARTRARGWRAIVARLGSLLGVLLIVGVPIAAPASAVAPLSLTGQVTDQVNALGDRATEVSTALTGLRDSHQVLLYVVFVADFAGQAGAAWAAATGVKSGLGNNDVVLAVATTARRYGFAIDNNSAIPKGSVQTMVTRDVQPLLSKQDWAGAALAMATGLSDLAASSSGNGNPGTVTNPATVVDPSNAATSGSSSSGLTFALLAVLVAIVVVGVVLWLRRSRGGTPAGHGSSAAPSLGNGLDKVPTDKLNEQASAALIATDDAVRGSDQEVGFAEAQFGESAAAPYRAAVEAARADLAAAFALRQQLDDAIPETEPDKRSMLAEIITRCTRANAELNKQKASFDQLRKDEASAPTRLASARVALTELSNRLPGTSNVLTGLATRYPAAALVSVSGNLDRAKEQLTFVGGTLDQADGHLQQSKRSQAAGDVRTAENALEQVRKLLDAVDRADSDLGEATRLLDPLLAEVDKDVAQAEALLGQGSHDPELQQAITAATAAAAKVRAARNAGTLDPLAARQTLEQVDAPLDDAVAAARGDVENQQKAVQALEHALITASASVNAVSDYIDTRRGAVGPEARTRLAEGQRSIQMAQQAQRQGQLDIGLQWAQRAEVLGQQASSIAQADVADWEAKQAPNVRGSGMNGIGGAVLGGILIDSLLRGGHGGGGMFGGGGWSGGGGGGGGGDFGGGGGDFGGGGGGGGFGGGDSSGGGSF